MLLQVHVLEHLAISKNSTNMVKSNMQRKMDLKGSAQKYNQRWTMSDVIVVIGSDGDREGNVGIENRESGCVRRQRSARENGSGTPGRGCK